MPKSKIDESLYEMRSVLMRLYHSYWQGEEFYPARFVNGCAPSMEANGLIEKHGEGWRITETGIDEWAEMNRHALLLQPNQRSYLSGSQFFFLRDRLMKGSQEMKVCNVEGCGKPRMVSNKGKEMTMCPDHQRADWREKAIKRQKPKAAPKQVTTADVIGKVAAVEESDPDEQPDYQRIAVALRPIQHNCETCEAKRVIEALRAKSPKLAKLIDAMQAEVEAAAALGL